MGRRPVRAAAHHEQPSDGKLAAVSCSSESPDYLSLPLPGEDQPDRAHGERDHRGQQRVLGAHRGPRR
jgi:hypothetical protein